MHVLNIKCIFSTHLGKLINYSLEYTVAGNLEKLECLLAEHVSLSNK